MSHDEKVAAVQAGRSDGLTDEQIGDEHGATKGQVVGFRHRHVPELTGKERSVPTQDKKPGAETKGSKPAGTAQRSSAAKAASRPPRGILADPPSRPKLTTNEALMCTHIDAETKKRCAYHFEDPSTRRCRVHPK